MRVISFGPLPFLLLLCAEIAAYAVVLNIWGLGVAFAIGLGSLALGFLVLSRLGQGLGRIFAGAGPMPLSMTGFFSGGLMVAGAALLILPGFVTDFVGLLLVIASWALKWLPQRFMPRAPSWAAPRPEVSGQVTDLRPDEWSSNRQPPP